MAWGAGALSVAGLRGAGAAQGEAPPRDRVRLPADPLPVPRARLRHRALSAGDGGTPETVPLPAALTAHFRKLPVALTALPSTSGCTNRTLSAAHLRPLT